MYKVTHIMFRVFEDFSRIIVSTPTSRLPQENEFRFTADPRHPVHRDGAPWRDGDETGTRESLAEDSQQDRQRDGGPRRQQPTLCVGNLLHGIRFNGLALVPGRLEAIRKGPQQNRLPRLTDKKKYIYI